MKTKNKILAVVEIVIVLCSLFLVALPAIAADHNQTMQEASASEVTTASEDDYILGVYGNANEDDTIDMRDLTYVKLIFFGKKPETELADAKYDGKINPLDFIQIKLIIVGKEKELTVEDIFGDAVTVHKPIKRIIVMHNRAAQALRALNAGDKIVGVSSDIPNTGVTFFPELSKLPVVGSKNKPDYEAILTLYPDVVVHTSMVKKEELVKKLPGITVLYPIGSEIETFTDGMRKLGYIMDRKDEAEEFIDWYEGYFDTIKSRTDELSEDEKPRVYIEAIVEYYHSPTTNTIVDYAGGKDIAGDITGYIDSEWIIAQNPNIIVSCRHSGSVWKLGYDVDDPSSILAWRGQIMSRTGWASIPVVREEKVYVIDYLTVTITPAHIIGVAYMAKWFHPNLFEDLDPEAIHQEYLTRFQRIDYDLNEHGIFAYPPIEINDGLAGIPDKYKGQL